MAATTAIVNLELPTLYCEAFPSNAFLRLPLPEPTGTINALPAGRRGHEWQVPAHLARTLPIRTLCFGSGEGACHFDSDGGQRLAKLQLHHAQSTQAIKTQCLPTNRLFHNSSVCEVHSDLGGGGRTQATLSNATGAKPAHVRGCFPECCASSAPTLFRKARLSQRSLSTSSSYSRTSFSSDLARFAWGSREETSWRSSALSTSSSSM